MKLTDGVVRAVVAARPNVILPAGVRIGDVAEIAAAVAAGGWIDRAGQRVERAQGQIAADLRVQVNLQSVVVGVRFVGRQVDRVEAGIRQAGRGVVVARRR